MTFSENPAKLGLPSYHTDHWDPFFAACVDGGVTVCLHIGSSSSMITTAPEAPPEVMISLTPINSLHRDHRHPLLRGASSDSRA